MLKGLRIWSLVSLLAVTLVQSNDALGPRTDFSNVCSIINRDSVPAQGVILDCGDLDHGCQAVHTPYCESEGCFDFQCDGDLTCLIGRLPVGSACNWTCKDDQGSYVNCITGELEVTSTSTTIPLLTEPSSVPTYIPTSSTALETSTFVAQTEGEATTTTMASTCDTSSEANDIDDGDTTTYDGDQPGIATEEGPSFNVKALPTAAACVGVAGGLAGSALYFLHGPISAEAPQLADTRAAPNPVSTETVGFGEHGVNGGAGGATQGVDHGFLQNRVENVVETVHGATSEEGPNLDQRLLQLSQGLPSDPGGTATGVITSEVASKFLENMISPFYK